MSILKRGHQENVVYNYKYCWLIIHDEENFNYADCAFRAFLYYMCLIARKPVLGVLYKVRFKQVCSGTEIIKKM